MSPLQRFLERFDGSRREFASRVGVDPSRISRYVSGEAIPGTDVAAAIETVTNGDVPADYWARLAKARRERRTAKRARRLRPAHESA